MTGLSIEGNITFTRADSLVLSYYMDTNEAGRGTSLQLQGDL